MVVNLSYVFIVCYRGVDPSEALRLPGVKTYVGVDDVPGHNATGPVLFDEEVFASEKVVLNTIRSLITIQNFSNFSQCYRNTLEGFED